MNSSDKNKYWALLDAPDIGDELMAKVEKWDEWFTRSGHMSEIRRSYKTYFNVSGTTVNKAGEQGELLEMHVNHYSNLITHLLNMVTSQRPAWDPRATNTDSKSQSQCLLASGILDFYMREKRLERHLKQATELSLFMREGWISAEWNATGGSQYVNCFFWSETNLENLVRQS